EQRDRRSPPGARVRLTPPRGPRAAGAHRRADRGVRAARRARSRRASRAAGRGALDRAHGARARDDPADRPQRRSRRGPHSAGVRQRRVRDVHRRRERDRPAGVREDPCRPAVGRGRGLHRRTAHLDRRHARARDPRRGRDAGHRPVVLLAHGAARRVRRRHPRRARDAVAAVAAADPRGLAARDHGADRRPARGPRHRRRPRGSRDRRRWLAGVRRSGPRLGRRGGRVPRPERRVVVARGAEQRRGEGHACADDRHRHRPAQLRRWDRDRLGLRGRRARPRRVPRHRLRDPQHDRGPGDRLADRVVEPDAQAPRAARPHRGRSRCAGRLARRGRVQRERRSVPVRPRRRRDRPGHRAAAARAARRGRAHAAPGRGRRPARGHGDHVRHRPARQRV
ncbi:MAG: hypothetical protein AVDCRST_MAG85-4007, partial [uncultured Solirubrobacteraceae bacterium]